MAARTSAAEPATTPSRARRTAKADEPQIIVRGAREHNLKNVNVDLPRDKLIVFTGLSGSGKSSLAFDTIYAEGQRRYVESLSAYARQFLGQMDKPDVDVIEGLSPAISIDQKSASRNPRSTVGTITEVYDYLRLLYARIGIQHCPNDGTRLSAPDPAADRRPHPRHGRRHPVPGARAGRAWAQGRVRHAARGPVRPGLRAGPHRRRDRRHRRVPEARRAAREVREPHDRGRRRPARVEGRHRAAPHRLARDGARARRRRGRGRDRAAARARASRRHSRSASTWRARICGTSYDEPAPRNFSFNSPYGACAACDGLGTTFEVDPELVVPDPDLSLADGAIAPWRSANTQYFTRMLESVAEVYEIDMNTPWEQLTAKQQKVVLHGVEGQADRQVQEPLRAVALVHHRVRGRDPVDQASPRGQPRATGPVSSTRATCARCRARRAAARGSSRRRWRSPSTASTSPRSATCRSANRPSSSRRSSCPSATG